MKLTRYASIVLALFLTFSLVSCGEKQEKENSTTSESSTASTTENAKNSEKENASPKDENEPKTDTKPEQTLAENEPSSTGDGYAPKEKVLKLIKWIDEGHADNLTYEEVRDYIGVDGFDCGNDGSNKMTNLGDHYFDWYADKTHFIHVCFRGRDETGRFECCQWNTSGFDSSEWKNISLTD